MSDSTSTEIEKPGDVKENINEPGLDQTEIVELATVEDVVMLEEAIGEGDLEQHLEISDELEAEESKQNEDDADYFQTEVIDEAGLQDDEVGLHDDEVGLHDDEAGLPDDEDGKENHEGDGEHDDLKEDEPMDEDEEEEDEDDPHSNITTDPNVMPQVNVAVLAQRKWQVKVYPLKPSDFANGQISRVFKHARESLLYLLSPGKNARGKGEMYISSVNQVVRCAHSLMRLEFCHPEINVEIIKKNEEGEVEEKGYVRFDSKLTQILSMRPTYRRGPGGGRKRDRLIGSVFVKNLPPGTTKDMLRVMFPFAQEINYNPEKFKQCTARLVLHYRSHVIPCLKAFAKVELGGNVLELHPLTKRKRTRTDEDSDVSEPKQRRKSEDPKKEVTVKKTEESTKIEMRSASTAEKKDQEKPQTTKDWREKPVAAKPAASVNKGKRDDQDKDPRPPQKRAPRKPRNHVPNDRGDNSNKPYRPKLVGGKERGGPIFSGSKVPGKPARGGTRGRQERSPASSTHSYRDYRSRDPRPADHRTATNNRNNRPRGSAGGRQSSTSLSRSGYGMSSGLGLGAASMAASDANLAINAEATKEMVLLQSQLSMAIKNQLAMLNQTQLAVEQAKRGASSIGLGSDIQPSLPSRTSHKGNTSASSSRRSLDQYRPAESLDDGLDRYSSRARNAPKMQRRTRGGGVGGRGYRKRATGGGSGSYRNEMDDWEREVAPSHMHDPYASSHDYGYERSSMEASAARSYQSSGYGDGYGDGYF